MLTNNNDTATRDAKTLLPDPHGQAALLLVESLIHGLCDKSALDVPEAIAIVERAVDIQREHVDDASRATVSTMLRAQILLETIAASLKADDVGPWPPLRLIT